MGDMGSCWDLAPQAAATCDSVKAKIQDKESICMVPFESGIGTHQALVVEVANEIRDTVVQNTFGPDMLSGGMNVRAESGIASQHALVVEVANEIGSDVQDTIGPDIRDSVAPEITTPEVTELTSSRKGEEEYWRSIGGVMQPQCKEDEEKKEEDLPMFSSSRIYPTASASGEAANGLVRGSGPP